MRMIKQNKNSSKPELTRQFISSVGERLFNFNDVDMVVIQAEFKDGSGIRFRKCLEDEE